MLTMGNSDHEILFSRVEYTCMVSTSKYDSEMVCATRHFFVIMYSIVIVHSRMRFKMKTCDNVRDVTFLYDSIVQWDMKFSISRVVHKELCIQHIIKSMTKNDNEACLNVSFVASYSSYKIVNIKNLRSVNAFFNYENFDSVHNGCPDCHTNLKEFLNLFEIQKEKSRTLVFFSERYLKQDIVDILYRLQSEKNVRIILVSMFADILKLKQFPRHLKFLLSHNIFEPLVDVIKNPEFNRFDFQDFSAVINTRRSCLENVTVVLVVSESYELILDQFIINSLINLNSEIFKVHILVNMDTDIFLNLCRYFVTHNTGSLFSYSNTLLPGFTKADLLAGVGRKVFLFTTLSSPRSRTIRNKLKNSGEVVVELLPRSFHWSYTDDNSLYLMDTLVDIGCK